MMFEQRESVVASDLLLSPEADRRSLLKRAHQNSGSESQNNGTNFRKRLHSDHGSPISAAQGIESNEEILDSNGVVLGLPIARGVGASFDPESTFHKFAGAQQEYRAFDIMDDLAKKIEPVHRAVIEFESLDDDMDIDQMDSTWDVENGLNDEGRSNEDDNEETYLDDDELMMWDADLPPASTSSKSTRLVEMIANLDVSQKEEIKQLIASTSSVNGDGSSRSSSNKSDYSAPWQQVVDILAQSDAQSSKEERQSLVEDLSSDTASWRMLRDCILEASLDGEATSGKSTRSLDSSTKEVLMAWADSSSDKITENRSDMQSNSGSSRRSGRNQSSSKTKAQFQQQQQLPPRLQPQQLSDQLQLLSSDAPFCIGVSSSSNTPASASGHNGSGIAQQPKKKSSKKDREKDKDNSARGNYRCGRCGQPKVNHVCEFVDAVASTASTQVSTGPLYDLQTGRPFLGERFITVGARRETPTTSITTFSASSPLRPVSYSSNRSTSNDSRSSLSVVDISHLPPAFSMSAGSNHADIQGLEMSDDSSSISFGVPGDMLSDQQTVGSPLWGLSNNDGNNSQHFNFQIAPVSPRFGLQQQHNPMLIGQPLSHSASQDSDFPLNQYLAASHSQQQMYQQQHLQSSHDLQQQQQQQAQADAHSSNGNRAFNGLLCTVDNQQADTQCFPFFCF